MPLDPERHAQARTLFDELAELSAAARADAWRAHADVDPAVRAQVESWLGADPGSEADTAAFAPIDSLRADWKAQRWQGRRVGQFELISLLGEGGMGSVWLGERRDGNFVQRAAIKLLNTRAAASLEMQRRFTTEREILAALDHPGIARLIDGGDTDDGVPYLVMEHVDGERIDHWCATHRAGFEQRVRLVLSICESLQAAHAALIVHRDLKPANILVDAQGRTRLLDFGIAKAIDASGLQHTVFETAADQRLMTLRYASPEQVRGERVGIASDQYSLGVVMYELLAGASPYRDADTASLNLMQAICSEDPQPPSRIARSRTDTLGERLAQARRGFGGDLDAIVLKALRKSPGERYASIDAFADDLRRLLDGQPVQARQGDGWYRARKFARRHRVALALGIMAVLALGTIALNWRWQRDEVARERDKAVQTTRFLTDLFEQANPMNHRGQVPDAVAMAERGAEALLADPALDPETRAVLLHTSAHVLLAIGRYPQALAVADAAFKDASAWEPGQPDLAVRLRLLQADALAQNRRNDEAVAVLERLLAGALSHDQHIEGRALRCEALNLLARIEFERNRTDAAAAVLEDGMRSWRSSFARDPLVAANGDADVPGAELLASLLLTRCRLAVVRERGAEALARCTQAQAFRERHFAPDHPGQLNVLQELSVLAGNANDDTRALALSEQILERTRDVFGDAHPRTAVAALNLGVEYRAARRFEEAVAQYRHAHEVLRATRGEQHPHTLMALNNWANVAYAMGDYEVALRKHRDVQAQRRATLPGDDPDLAQSATNVAKSLWRLARHGEAEAELMAAPVIADAGAARSHGLLAAELRLALGDAAGALARVRPIHASIVAAAPDVRGLAAACWIELRALAATGADATILAAAWLATEEALAKDDSRDLIDERALAAWRASQPSQTAWAR